MAPINLDNNLEKGFDWDEDPLSLLNAMISSYIENGRGITETYRMITELLCHQLKPQPKWGWEYIHQVSHKKLPLTRRLVSAIGRLATKQKRMPHLSLESVEVLAPTGNLPHGTIVLSRAIKCAHIPCRRYFVPANPNHRYCSVECRQSSQKHDRSGLDSSN